MQEAKPASKLLHDITESEDNSNSSSESFELSQNDESEDSGHDQMTFAKTDKKQVKPKCSAKPNNHAKSSPIIGSSDEDFEIDDEEDENYSSRKRPSKKRNARMGKVLP